MSDSFEAAVIRNRPLPLNFEELRGKEFIAPREYRTPRCYTVECSSAYSSPYGICYDSFLAVPESMSNYAGNWHHYLSFFKKLLQRRILLYEGTAINFYNPFFDNYYHFTCECLPRLHLALRRDPTARPIIHERSPDFVRRFLEVLGTSKPIELPATQLAYGSLVIPSQTCEVHKQHPPLIKSMVETLKDAVPADTWTNIHNARVFVSRRAKYRKLSNSEQVETLLRRWGFRTVFFEDIDVAEAIQIMSHARTVVAIHGAGLSNIMFMPSGGLVVNLIHEGHHDDSFYNLATVFQLRTVFIQGKGARTTHDVCTDDFCIDVGSLEEALIKYVDNQG